MMHVITDGGNGPCIFALILAAVAVIGSVFVARNLTNAEDQP